LIEPPLHRLATEDEGRLHRVAREDDRVHLGQLRLLVDYLKSGRDDVSPGGLAANARRSSSRDSVKPTR
jgi:hypothetical protein